MMMHSITVYADHLLDIKICFGVLTYKKPISVSALVKLWMNWDGFSYDMSHIQDMISAMRKRILQLKWHDLWLRLFQPKTFGYSRVFQTRKKNVAALVEVQLFNSSIIFAYRSPKSHRILRHIFFTLFTVVSGQPSFIESKVIRIYRLAGVTRMHDVSWPSIIPSYHSGRNVQPCWPWISHKKVKMVRCIEALWFKG